MRTVSAPGHSEQSSRLTDQLAQLIEQESGALARFIELLGEEKNLLCSTRTDQLTALTEEKTRQYLQLQQMADARIGLLARHGIRLEQARLDALLQPVPALHSAWNALLDLARQAEQQNQANGHLIQARMQHTQRALGVLLSAPEQAAVYGPDGQSRAGAGSRHWGSA